MKEIQGKPMLEYQIERVKRSKIINQIVIATTTKEIEQPIINLCEKLSIDYYRGSEDDVLSRYYEAAAKYDAEVVVRITGDDPLVDPKIIDDIIIEFLSNHHYDYVSNSIEKTFPLGLDVEVISMKALEQAYQEAKDQVYREHVTPYIYLHPKKFHLGLIKHPTDLSSYRLTVDSEEDFLLMTRLMGELYKKKKACFTLEDIILLLKQNPTWTLLNSHISQKKLEGER